MDPEQEATMVHDPGQEHAHDRPEPTGDPIPGRPEDVQPDHTGAHPTAERSGRSRSTMIGLAIALVAAVLLYVAIVSGIAASG
jgi:hypothetical protein